MLRLVVNHVDDVVPAIEVEIPALPVRPRVVFVEVDRGFRRGANGEDAVLLKKHGHRVTDRLNDDAANFLAANLWLAPQGWARADLTQGSIYSLSEATKGYLAQLREPLLIRGYFSAQTHPLLAPLVPQVRDLLQEYAQAGGDRVQVEGFEQPVSVESKDEKKKSEMYDPEIVKAAVEGFLL